MTQTILNLNAFKVLDESNHKIYYGCDQEWYTTEWQRCAGCGPSVATNIFMYLSHTGSTLEEYSITKENCLLLMEEAWKYVTPTPMGIPTTKMFYEYVLAYTKTKGINVEYGFCDLPEDKSCRPTLLEVRQFIEGALSKDTPIAFLNLCNGDEKNLDRWHWVTIISLDYKENEDSADVTFLDEGFIKKIDLSLWYHTTTLGGGFVYFINPKRMSQSLPKDIVSVFDP